MQHLWQDLGDQDPMQLMLSSMHSDRLAHCTSLAAPSGDPLGRLHRYREPRSLKANTASDAPQPCRPELVGSTLLGPGTEGRCQSSKTAKKPLRSAALGTCKQSLPSTSPQMNSNTVYACSKRKTRRTHEPECTTKACQRKT